MRDNETGMPAAVPSGFAARLDRVFGIGTAGGTVGAELRGGLTTFATMAYIVVVNADMLSRAGIPFDSAVFATCASAAVGTFLMAWWANYPFAIGAPAFWVAGAGLLLTGGLVARKVTGALLRGVLATAALAVAVGEAGLPAAWVALPAASGSLLQWDLRGTLDPRFLDIVVALLFVDFFDTMGTLLGVAVQGKFLDEEANLPRDGRAMSADATATVVGAALGTPPVTTYVESAAGIAAGARTGLANMVVVAGFLGAMFFAPALAAVPSFATAPALIVVGALMTAGLARIDWGDGCDRLAAFVTTLAIPLTFSISDGMALGVLTYVGAKGFAGKRREVPWIVWVLAAVFLLRYLLLPAD